MSIAIQSKNFSPETAAKPTAKGQEKSLSFSEVLASISGRDAEASSAPEKDRILKTGEDKALENMKPAKEEPEEGEKAEVYGVLILSAVIQPEIPEGNGDFKLQIMVDEGIQEVPKNLPAAEDLHVMADERAVRAEDFKALMPEENQIRAEENSMQPKFSPQVPLTLEGKKVESAESMVMADQAVTVPGEEALFIHDAEEKQPMHAGALINRETEEKKPADEAKLKASEGKGGVKASSKEEVSGQEESGDAGNNLKDAAVMSFGNTLREDTEPSLHGIEGEGEGNDAVPLDLMEPSLLEKTGRNEPLMKNPAAQPSEELFSRNLREASESIVKSFETMKEGDRTTMKMVLHPEELGKMEITLTLHEGKLVGKILLDNPDARNLFSAKLGDLRDSLAKNHIMTAAFDVEVGQGMAGHEGRQGNGQESGQKYMGAENRYAGLYKGLGVKSEGSAYPSLIDDSIDLLA